MAKRRNPKKEKAARNKAYAKALSKKSASRSSFSGNQRFSQQEDKSS
ncbi:hypothetical protein [Myxosarcina sp. GI1]|nr:hypothetical protein [Myxosarcina sp. GI1]